MGTCLGWAQAGECTSNPVYMQSECCCACNTCSAHQPEPQPQLQRTQPLLPTRAELDAAAAEAEAQQQHAEVGRRLTQLLIQVRFPPSPYPSWMPLYSIYMGYPSAIYSKCVRLQPSQQRQQSFAVAAAMPPVHDPRLGVIPAEAAARRSMNSYDARGGGANSGDARVRIGRVAPLPLLRERVFASTARRCAYLLLLNPHSPIYLGSVYFDAAWS